MTSSKTLAFSHPLKKILVRRQAESSNEPEADELGENWEQPPRLVPEAELEEARKAAYHEGLAAGRAQAEDEAEAFLQSVRSRMGEVIDRFDQESGNLVQELEGLLPEYIIEGVGRILYGLEPDRETVQKVVQDLLFDSNPGEQEMRLFLNPDDIKLIKELEPKLQERFPGLSILPEDSLHSGESYLDSRFGIADARFSAKLRNLRKVLE